MQRLFCITGQEIDLSCCLQKPKIKFSLFVLRTSKGIQVSFRPVYLKIHHQNRLIINEVVLYYCFFSHQMAALMRVWTAVRKCHEFEPGKSTQDLSSHLKITVEVYWILWYDTLRHPIKACSPSFVFGMSGVMILKWSTSDSDINCFSCYWKQRFISGFIFPS